MSTPPSARTRVATVEPASPLAPPSPQAAQRARAQRDTMRIVRRAIRDLILGVRKEEAATLALAFRDGAAEGGFGVACRSRMLLVYPEKDGETIRFRAGAFGGRPGMDRRITVTPLLKQALVEQAAGALVRDFIAEVSGG